MKNQVKATGYNGFPVPKKVKCSDCGENLFVKFVISRCDYSQKNSWGYWTDNQQEKENYKCNSCLRLIYRDKLTYLKAVQNTKKRNLFRVYLHEGNI